MVDVSSPLTIEHYLRATLGGAVGLDVCPERFCNAELRNSLDPISKIPGLALTGQDIALCGVTLCQVINIIITTFFDIFKNLHFKLVTVIWCYHSVSIGRTLCSFENYLAIYYSGKLIWMSFLWRLIMIHYL